MKSLANWIINLYKNFYFIIFLIIGLVLVFINSIIIHSPTLENIATAILTSGVFTVALKSFQYTEIFKQELGKVISSNDFLENFKEKRLIQIWNDCTLILCERRFPEISHELFEYVRDNYLTKGLDYYYPDIQLTIELDYYNSNSSIIISRETSVIKIKAMSAEVIKYKFGSIIDKMPDVPDAQCYRLEEFSVDGQSLQLKPEIKEFDDSKLIVDQEVPLSGKLEYTILKAESRIESLKTNSDILSFKIGRLTRRWRFNVKNNTKLKLEYLPIGTVREFVDDNEALKLHGYNVSKVSNGFVMLGQGFGLLLKE
jgi:hypothetical protein